MGKRIKRAGALAAAGLLLAVSLAGCGGQETGVRIVENSPADPEYISFFSEKKYSDNDIGKYWSDHFARQYNQQVYVNYDGAAYYEGEGLSYRELLEKRLESASPDDLYTISAEDVLEFEKKGYWMDLSDMDFVDNLSPAALYQSTYDGKVFSVPLTFTGFGFFWNVTLLEEHGLAVPENLEEFMAVCEKLKSEGILPYGANKGYALTVPAMCRGLASLYGSEDQQQRISDLNSGVVPVSAYMEEGFAFLEQMIEKGYLDPDQAMNAAPRKEDLELFLSGGCAFMCLEMGATLDSSKNPGFKTDFTGLPILEDGCIAVYGADSRLCVNPKSEHLDTVLKFIEMVGTPEALDESAAWERKMSCAKDSRAAVSPIQEKMVNLLQQPGQIPNQDFSLRFNTWENIRDVGREICGGLSVQEACDMLDEKQRTELETYAGK